VLGTFVVLGGLALFVLVGDHASLREVVTVWATNRETQTAGAEVPHDRARPDAALV